MMDSETSPSVTSSCSNITRFDISLENQELSRIDFDSVSAELNALLDKLRRVYETEESLDRRVHKMTASLETQRLAKKLTRKIYFHLRYRNKNELPVSTAPSNVNCLLASGSSDMTKTDDLKKVSSSERLYTVARKTTENFFNRIFRRMLKSPDSFESQEVHTAFKELQNEVSHISIPLETQRVETVTEDDQLKPSPTSSIKSPREGQHPSPVTCSVPDTFEHQKLCTPFEELQDEVSNISITPEIQNLESTDIEEGQVKSIPLKQMNSLTENAVPDPVTCNVADIFENQDVDAVLKKLQSEVSDTSISPDTQRSESTITDDGQLNSFSLKLIKSFMDNVAGQLPDPVTCSVSNTFESQQVRAVFKELQNEISNISVSTDTKSSESTDIDDDQLKSFPQKLIKSLMENEAVQHPNPVTTNVPYTLQDEDVFTAIKKLRSEVSNASISPEIQNLESTVIDDDQSESFPQKVINSLVKNVAGQHANPVTCSLPSTSVNQAVRTAFKKLQNHVSNISIPKKTHWSESTDNDDGQSESFPRKVVNSLVKNVAGQKFIPEPCTASVEVPTQPYATFAQVPPPEPGTAFEHVPSAEKSSLFKFFKRPATGTIPSKLSSIGRKHHHCHTPNILDQGTNKPEVAAQAGQPGVDPTAHIKDRAGQDKQEKGIQCFEHGIAQGEDDWTDCFWKNTPVILNDCC
ncbi:uncharacterized protein LOC122834644 [Gambusia affinis]|uniref:uncharacterized protein LOC122834644 n=1 Tax=Gambusia affinis TaxID=33528 RepID=UPI001CDB4DC1|nr:uncharacterized protein LOC122834644 [Gambusia affinis]